MSLHLPWASALDAAIACAASAVLPKIREPAGEPAERGVKCHSFLEDVPVIGRDTALAKVPEEYRYWCSQIDTGRLYGGLQHVDCERVYAIDVVAGTARLLEKSNDNNYAIEPDEFPGRCDVVAFLNDGTPVVADHKTGKELGKLSDLYQLRFFALALHLLTGRPFIEIRVNYVEPDGAVRIVLERLGPSDHDETLTTLRNLRVRLLRVHEQLQRGETPSVTTGDQCHFCKAYATCPAKLPLLKSVLPDLEELSDQIDMMTPTAIAAAWTKTREVASLLERVKAVVDEATKRVIGTTGIPMGDNQVLRWVESSSKQLNQSKLIALAKDKGAADEAIAACYTTNRFSFPKVTKVPAGTGQRKSSA